MEKKLTILGTFLAAAEPTNHVGVRRFFLVPLARHASTELIQCTPELEKAAVAAWNAFVGAQRPPNLQRE
jgi:hypothetical protein